MGSPKALLPDGEGRLFLTRLLHTFWMAGVGRLVVVTGGLHGEIVAAVAAGGPRGATVAFARNPDPRRGQLSSVITGLDAVDRPGVGGILMAPVDVPFVAPSTVRAVMDEWRRTRAPIVRPARGERHGHPVLFGRETFADLRRADLAGGARTVVHAYAPRVVNLEVDDPGALRDVDTREEYERALRERVSPRP